MAGDLKVVERGHFSNSALAAEEDAALPGQVVHRYGRFLVERGEKHFSQVVHGRHEKQVKEECAVVDNRKHLIIVPSLPLNRRRIPGDHRLFAFEMAVGVQLLQFCLLLGEE